MSFDQLLAIIKIIIGIIIIIIAFLNADALRDCERPTLRLSQSIIIAFTLIYVIFGGINEYLYIKSLQ